MKPDDITAIVLTRNEELTISRALASLPPGVRLLVIDSQSTDRTREIAAAQGAHVIERPWRGFVDARIFGLANVQTDWVFALDADEVLDDRLRASILAAGGDVEGYCVRRDTYFCGKPMRLWENEKLLRLFQTSRVRTESHPVAGGTAELHERYAVEGATRELDGTLLHYSYPDVASYRVKYQRYTSLEAEGLRGNTPPFLRFAHLVGVMLGAIARFVWFTIGKSSLRDGWRGLYIAYFSAMYPVTVLRKSFQP